MSQEKKSTDESFGEMLTAFGSAISEIFNDPELKEKAKEFGDAAAESAKSLGKRFKDPEVKDKLKEAGKTAEEFGKGYSGDCTGNLGCRPGSELPTDWLNSLKPQEEVV